MLRLTLARAMHAPGQEGTSKSFNRARIAIGRAPDNDWVLPDPERHLSKTHCIIEFSDGGYAITDTSTNGVFLNGSAEPLGRDHRAAIKAGDRIELGGYQIEVHIDDRAAAADLDNFATTLAAAQEKDLDPFGLNRPAAGPTPASAAFGAGSPAQSGQGAGRGRGAIPDFDDFDDLFEGMDKPAGGRASAGPGDVFGPPPSRIDEAEIFGGPPRDDWDRSEADHAPSRAEFFRPPSVVSTPIPDDWDDLPPSTPPPKQPRPAFEDSPVRQTAELPGSEPFPTAPLDPAAAPEPAVATRPEPARMPEPVPDAEAVARAAVPKPVQPASPPRPEPPRLATEPAPRPASEPSPPRSSSSAGLALEAFLAGAGLNPDTLKLSDEEAERTMRAAGKAFRHMVEGLREVLMARSAIKNEFRVERTMIRAADNNPLKFSVSAEEALFALLRPVVAGYLPADRAVEEALKDIKAHQLATMAGMQVAISKLLAQFDPEELKKQLEDRSLLNSILPGSKKARYWELYEKLYQEIAKTAEDDFHGSYGREFARAYEEQIRKL